MSRFEDERGVIEDGPDGLASTFITTWEGAVRGNHFHKETTQWTVVLVGSLLVKNGEQAAQTLGPGEVIRHSPGDPHAWKALEDSAALVLTKGPRKGDDFERDTYRLKEPLL